MDIGKDSTSMVTAAPARVRSPGLFSPPHAANSFKGAGAIDDTLFLESTVHRGVTSGPPQHLQFNVEERVRRVL